MSMVGTGGTQQPASLTSPIPTPKNFTEAMQITDWRSAIEKEVSTFIKADFDIIHSSHRHNHYTRLFTVKSDGTKKARLIIINPVDLKNKAVRSSSPVVKSSTITALLSKHTQHKDNILVSYDVKGAFVNTPITGGKRHRLKLPKGFEGYFNDSHVTILKQVYGLKDSPLGFYKYANKLLANHFTKAKSDSCLNISKTNGSVTTTICNWVDDFLMSTDDPSAFEQAVESKFELKKKCNRSVFLGYELGYGESGITASTTKFFNDWLMEQSLELRKVVSQGSTHPFTSTYNNAF